MATAQTTRSGVSSLWFTHAESGDPQDPYLAAFRESGRHVFGHPFIERRPENVSVIGSAIEEALKKSPSAIVFTSVFPAQVLMGLKSELNSKLFALPCLTIDGGSVEKLNKLGWNVSLAKGKNSEELAEAIIKENASGPLLFPCGDKRKDTLPQRLQEAGIEVLDIVAYKTVAPDFHMVEVIKESWYKETPRWVVFFSPSAVTTATTKLKDLPWQEVKAVAIGRTTARALTEAGFRIEGIAERPTSEEVLKILERTSNDEASK